jgi:hypothetical protein
LLPTSRLDASINLALEAAAGDDEVVLVDADAYGGAVAHANIQEHHRKLRYRGAGLGWGRPARAQPL